MSWIFFEFADVLSVKAADPEALDVAHGVPPPRAAPALLRRVVLNPRCVAIWIESEAAQMRVSFDSSFVFEWMLVSMLKETSDNRSIWFLIIVKWWGWWTCIPMHSKADFLVCWWYLPGVSWIRSWWGASWCEPNIVLWLVLHWSKTLCWMTRIPEKAR